MFMRVNFISGLDDPLFLPSIILFSREVPIQAQLYKCATQLKLNLVTMLATKKPTPKNGFFVG